MAASTAFATDLLEHIFNAEPIAGLSANHGTPITNIEVALHTSDPGAAGNQSTNEASYTNYERVNVARTSGGWTIAGNEVSPNSTISFPQAGATAGAALTHFSVGTGESNYMLLRGALNNPITVVADQTTPQLGTGTVLSVPTTLA